MKKIVVTILMLGLLINLGAGRNMLVSPLAGTWYPKDPDQLNTMLMGYLNNAKENKLNDVIALIVPHAGYKYSGQTAAYAMKEIEGKDYSRVIILGPSHYYGLTNKVSFPSFQQYKTPFGEIEVDRDFIHKLVPVLPYGVTFDVGHMKEHSIQIQLPFLQKALKNFKFVPILVGQLDDSVAKKIGEILKKTIDDKTLIVISSDFTHYGPNFNYVPFKNNFQIEDEIKSLDMGAVNLIKKKNPVAFREYINKTGDTICGKDPISILLYMLPEDTKIQLLHYDTSGSQTDNFENSVSYVSMAVTGKWDSVNKVSENKNELTQNDKEELLILARKSIEYYLKNKKIPTVEELGVKVSDNMKKVMGGFVSLYKNGELRGCIGEIYPTRPLYEAVIAQAVNAAVNDYRFPPVNSSEMPDIKIEISALTPPVEVKSYKDIVIGRDGMTLEKDGRRAVFLPQVAPEQGWNLEQTLSYLSLKAGLPMNAWKKDAKFSVFQAIVFNDRLF